MRPRIIHFSSPRKRPVWPVRAYREDRLDRNGETVPAIRGDKPNQFLAVWRSARPCRLHVASREEQGNDPNCEAIVNDLLIQGDTRSCQLQVAFRQRALTKALLYRMPSTGYWHSSVENFGWPKTDLTNSRFIVPAPADQPPAQLCRISLGQN